ncbi:GNAT family N-acetyltransferase, partial [Streptomyces ardesiacus]
MSDVTDAVASLAGHGNAVPAMVLASVAALIATAGLRTRRSRRHGHAPPPDDTGARPPSAVRPA